VQSYLSSSCLKIVFAVLVFCSCEAARAQDTSLFFNSPPGDFIGNGQQVTITPAQAAFSIQKNSDNSIFVSVTNLPATFWYLSLAAPGGALLVPGYYANAATYPPVQPPSTQPGLSFFGNGRGCGLVTGSFTVFQANYDANGNVLNFAADFSQSCQGEPPLAGSIRYNSTFQNAPAVITSISPSGNAVGIPFTLTVNGSNFLASSTIQWNGANTPTLYVNTTQLNASIPSANVAAAGTAQVTVFTPGPTGGTSNALTFTIGGAITQQTYLSFNSPPGDYVGGGQQVTITSGQQTFSVQKFSDNSLTFTVDSRLFDLELAAPGGALLVPGNYPNATRAATHAPNVPGLDFDYNGSGCNTLTGSFAVLDATYDASGNVLTFAADFEQSCEGFMPPLTGSIRYKSAFQNGIPVVTSLSPPSNAVGTPFTLSVNGSNFVAGSTIQWNGVSLATQFVTGAQLTAVVPATDVASAGTAQVTVVNPGTGGGASNAITFTIGGTITAQTALFFRSDPGDFIGQGQQMLLTPDQARVLAKPQSHGVEFNIQNPAGSQLWSLDLVPPSGASLVPGIYLNAARYPFQSSTQPGLSFSGQGRGCNMVTGSFTVLEANYDANGNVVNFAADFIQYCDSTTAAVNGSIRYNSNITNPIPIINSLSPTTVGSGSPGFTLTVNGSNFLSNSVAQWNGFPVPTTFVSTSQLTAAIPAGAVINPGPMQVTVFNPGLQEGSSNALIFTVTSGPPQPPSAVSVSPTGGTGTSQSFTLVYSDPNGAADINAVSMVMNTTNAPANGCVVVYVRASNQVLLKDDGGVNWAGAGAPGTAATIHNSQCTVDLSQSSVLTSPANLTLTLALSFSNSFVSAKNIYMYAVDNEGMNSGWQKLGTWTPAVDQPPQVQFVSPSSGSGSSQTFSTVYADPNGGTDISYTYFGINATFGSVNSCLILYSRATNQAYLTTDAGTGLVGPGTLGTAATLQNSQCSLNLQTAAATTSGNNLTVNLPISFKSAFAGAKSIFVNAIDVAGMNSGWQVRGNWTVQ
jgi:hypothetical protein